MGRGCCAQALDQIQAEVDGVAGACRRINAALQASKAASAEMVGETERVERDLAINRNRAQLVTHFLAQYQLTAEEVAALQVVPGSIPGQNWSKFSAAFPSPSPPHFSLMPWACALSCVFRVMSLA